MALVRIVDGKGGAPVAVARLADRTGVDQIPRVLLQEEITALGATALGRITGFYNLDFVTLVGQCELDMGMPEKNQWSGRSGESRARRMLVGDVFILTRGRAVHEFDAAERRFVDRADRHRAQPGKILRGKVVASPLYGLRPRPD